MFPRDTFFFFFTFRRKEMYKNFDDIKIGEEKKEVNKKKEKKNEKNKRKKKIKVKRKQLGY